LIRFGFVTDVSIWILVYNLRVQTSTWYLSGTDDTVGIQLIGDMVQGPWEFYSGKGDRFERKR